MVGAGASADFGLPLSTDIDQIFSETAGQLYPLADDKTSNFYRYYSDKLKKWTTDNSKDIYPLVNFEDALFRLSQLESVSNTSFNNNYEALLQATRNLPDVLYPGVGEE